MDVDLIFKIAAVGILVAVLNMLLSRSGRDDQALMTSIAGLLVVLVRVPCSHFTSGCQMPWRVQHQFLHLSTLQRWLLPVYSR